MPGAAGGYLPPAVASLVGDSDDAIRKIAEVKVSLEDLADTPTTVKIDADIAPLEAGLAEARAEADAATALPITFTTTVVPPSLADIAAARALGGFATSTGGGGMFSGLAGVAAAHAAGSGGGGGGFVPGVAMGAAAAGGGKGGGPGLLAALGWGRGMLGMAGMGSILSLAGFGPEHLLTTGLGLAGSAAGGLLGGGLLASGWAGTAAVGGGSDAAVMKSVITDTFTAQKSLYNQYANLTNQVLIYGAASAQAAAAQADLNNQMIILGNTAGVAAELGLAKSVDALNRYWDQATSGARIAAVSILSQGVTLANTYIPLVADAAQKNLTIISTGLRPLFSWLEGPQGIGIFNHLEAVFARNLPTAVDAFNQAVMLVLRTVDVASNYTGGFIVKVDQFLQRMNSPAGFARWSVEIGKLIGMFRDWEALLKIATLDVVDFFKLSSGLGTGIVLSLTQALTSLNAWEIGVSGSNQLHALFAAHLNEVLDALKLVYGIVPGLAEVYLHLATPLTIVADAFIRFADFILNTPIIGQLVAYGWAISFVAGKMQLLTVAKFIGDIPILGGLIVKLVGWLGSLAAGWLGVATAADTAATAQTAAGTASVASAAESSAAGGARLTGGGLLGLLSGGATTGPEFAAAFAGFGAAAAAAAGLGGLIYGTGYALEVLTGDINNIGGQFRVLANPVSQLVANANVSDQAASTIRNALTSNSPQIVLALSQLAQSTWVTHLASYQQQSLMEDLASAMQKGLVTTPNDVRTFGQAWHEAESKTVLGVPLIEDVFNTFRADSAALKTALTHIVANFESVDHTSTATTVPAAQQIANAFQQTVPISQQIQSILKYTQTGASNVSTGIWNAYGGANSLSNALWGSTGPASSISPAASSLATQLWAASGAASALRGLIAGDFGNLAANAGGISMSPHALGGTIAAGTWGIINEIGPEPIYARPGGGIDVIPSSRVTPLVPLGGSAYRGYVGSGGASITIHAPISGITFQGTPASMLADFQAIVQRNNEQLASAIGA